MKVTAPARQKTQLPGSGSVRWQPSTRVNQSADRSRSWTARTGLEPRICTGTHLCPPRTGQAAGLSGLLVEDAAWFELLDEAHVEVIARFGAYHLWFAGPEVVDDGLHAA